MIHWKYIKTEEGDTKTCDLNYLPEHDDFARGHVKYVICNKNDPGLYNFCKL